MRSYDDRTSRLVPGACAVLMAASACMHCSPADPPGNPVNTVAERLGVEVVAGYPHDRGAFTQGLLWHNGTLYESTGGRDTDRYGPSTLRQVEIATGARLQKRVLDGSLFGEGLERVDNRLIQLTWTSGRALVYDLDSFDLLTTHDYEGEGWGLCYDGERLIMSDGSSSLTFREPDTFAVLGRVEVRRSGTLISQLNELECANGRVYANIWQTDEIIVIDPRSGAVESTIDARGLSDDGSIRDPAAVLNGIAYNPERDVFYVTGKLWPVLYEVRFPPAPAL